MKTRNLSERIWSPSFILRLQKEIVAAIYWMLVGNFLLEFCDGPTWRDCANLVVFVASGAFIRILHGSFLDGTTKRRQLRSNGKDIRPMETKPTGSLEEVLELKAIHAETWRDRPESYWLAGLRRVSNNLSTSVVYHGWKTTTVDVHLCEIASIALNWLEYRSEEKSSEASKLRKFRKDTRDT